MINRLLFIEDDDLTQKMIRKIFEGEFAVETCASAEEFYQKYKSDSFDIVIMDISLKGEKHGIDLTKELKTLPAYSKTPILCLTAHAFQKDRTNAFHAGVDAFLTKPVQNSMLKETVQSLISNTFKKWG